MERLTRFIALNRFGLGIAPGEPEGMEQGPRKWIERQIVRRQTIPASLSTFPSAASILKDIHEARLEGPEKPRETAGRHYRQTFSAEAGERITASEELRSCLAAP